MSFREQLAADALAVFCNPAELGEEVTYYPSGQEFGPVTLSAVVERREVDPSGFGATQALVQEAVVHLPRTLVPTVVKGKDLMDVVLFEGMPPVRCRVVRVTHGDAGMWDIEVQK